MHVRKQIRDALVTAVTGLPGVNDVTVGRVFPEYLPNLPAITVRWISDESDDDGAEADWPRVQDYWQTLTLAVEIRASVSGYAGELDDELDRIAVEAEKAIAADPTLGGLCRHLKLMSSNIDRSGDMEKPVGLLVLEYETMYRFAATDPETFIP